MPTYRVTIRHGRPQEYHIEDVEAEGLGEALRRAAEEMPPEVEEEADLAEIRRRVAGDEERDYTPG